jgi:hypothetical protein
LGNSETTFAGADVGGSGTDIGDQPQGLYGPEDVFNKTLLNNLADDGPFTDAVDYEFHSTKYSHQAGLPLKVLQYAWAIQSDLAGATYEGDVVYQTYVIINTHPTDSVYGIEIGLTHDIDVPPGAGSNLTGIDTQLDNVWAYETTVPDNLQGYFRLPRDNVNTLGSDVLRGISRSCPGFTEFYDVKSAVLQGWWDVQEKSVQGCAADVWIINGARKFDLAPGESHTETFVWYGADVSSGASLPDRLREWALIAGYYRGDVNGIHISGGSPGTTLSDVQYLVNYWNAGAQDGPKPIPFMSQGDVNGDDLVNDADIIYLYNYVSTDGATPAPIDRDRFVPDPWNNRATGRPSLSDDTNWCNP